jgi:hypothetical protein
LRLPSLAGAFCFGKAYTVNGAAIRGISWLDFHVWHLFVDDAFTRGKSLFRRFLDVHVLTFPRANAGNQKAPAGWGALGVLVCCYAFSS